MLARGLALGCAAMLWLGPAALAQAFTRVEPVLGGAVAETAVTDKAAFIVQYDDGESDVTYAGTPAVGTWELAMLFEDVGGPDVTLGGVDVCMRRDGADPKIRYQIVLWAPDGPGGAPGTELAHFAAVATGIGAAPTFDSTNLGFPLTIQDVYIGVRYNPVVDPDYSFCIDRDGATVHPAFLRFEEGAVWHDVPAVTDPAYNAVMLRASLSTPGIFLESLLVPLFRVDTTSAAGTTTLFAVRNLTADPISADVEYFTVDGVSQGTEALTLDPFETRTTNLRDVPGLATDGDGVARGFVEISTPGNPDLTPVLGGDFFQVDVGDDFATGDRLVRKIDLCDDATVRFLEFPLPGSGTQLTVWIANPRGGGPADPPSFTVRVFDEAGNEEDTPLEFKVDAHALELPASFFSPLSFGTLRFDFGNSSGGTVYAESSVEGRFSIGVTSQCDDRP